MVFPLKLGLSALAFEGAAWSQLLLGTDSDAVLLSYLALHGVASVLLAYLAISLLPTRHTQPRLAVAALLSCPIFFVPILGFVGVMISVFAPELLPRFTRQEKFQLLKLPPPDPHERTSSAPFGRVGARGFLGNARAPMDLRMRALVGLQNVPSRVATPLLRDLLADPAEDIRLLAYGMLDTLEKKLNDQIHEALQLFRQTAEQDDANPVDRHQVAKRLAALYWELIYQGLAQGDLAKHASEEALYFTLLALEAMPNDAALSLLHGRLLHSQGGAEAARQEYERALQLGLPSTRVVPYLAELAFEQRNFGEVRQLIAALQGWQSLPKLQSVIQFWR